MKLVYVNEPERAVGNVELRLVRLEEGWGCDELWYGETPVTEGQWCEVMGGEIEKGRDYPKVKVSATEAEEFCRHLSEQTGRQFRLPTEVEQARAMGEEPPTGKLAEFAVFGREEIQPVKTKLANEYGLWDVRGLVWEWTAGKGDEVRHLRGGSWDLGQMLARAVFRHYFHPADRSNRLGFRVVWCRPPQQ